MRTIDFTPVFRSTIGFDKMARLVDAAFQASETSNQPTYPPYNIEKISDDSYRIVMALAGFEESDIEVTVKENSLFVCGKVERDPNDTAVSYLHRGIAARSFERHFDLADYIIVTNASLENGLLTIDLTREIPEEKKSRKIDITSITRELEQNAA